MTSTEKKDKPTWLQILEAESWQAELIVSGIAIYGSLQLPGLIKQGVGFVLIHLGAGYLDSFYFIFWYLIIASAVMIVNFIAHFVLRALWIGMIGLVSVFPQGIRPNISMYSSHYMERILEEFPDVNAFNRRLDDFCSSIFAFSFAIALLMVAITITLMLGAILTSLLNQIFPGLQPALIYPIIIGLVFFPAIVSGIFNLKVLREKAWVKRIHFPIFKFSARLCFNFAYRPVYYILFIFMSNLKTTKFGFTAAGYLLFVMFIGLPLLIYSDALYLRNDTFFDLDNQENRMVRFHYEDRLPENQTVYRPVISSDLITDSYLRVFIPRAQREQAAIDRVCSDYDEDTALSEAENELRRRHHRQDCYRSYYTIKLDGRTIDSLEFIRYRRANALKSGLVTYLPLGQRIKPGPHRLEIQYGYTNQSGERKKSLIPFVYAPENTDIQN